MTISWADGNNLAEIKGLLKRLLLIYNTIFAETHTAMTTRPFYETRLEGKQGGYVDIHAKTDRNKRKEHIEAAQVLADKGHQIILMPEIFFKDVDERKIYFPELTLENRSNPDLRLNGTLGDFKIPEKDPVGVSQIKNAIRTTAQKEVSICVISLLNRDYKTRSILSQIRGSLKFDHENKSIKEVWILFNNKSILRIPRKLSQHKDFYKLIDTF